MPRIGEVKKSITAGHGGHGLRLPQDVGLRHKMASAKRGKESAADVLGRWKMLDEVLALEPMTVPEIATKLKISPRSLERYLAIFGNEFGQQIECDRKTNRRRYAPGIMPLFTSTYLQLQRR